MTQSAFDPVAYDGGTHGLADHEPNLGMTGAPGHHMGDQCWAGRTFARADCLTKILSVAHAILAGKQNSGSELGAALATTRGQDRAAGAGAHTETEAVLLGATAVIRLESTLGHEVVPVLESGPWFRRPPLAHKKNLIMGTRQLSVRTIQRYGCHYRRSN